MTTDERTSYSVSEQPKTVKVLTAHTIKPEEP